MLLNYSFTFFVLFVLLCILFLSQEEAEYLLETKRDSKIEIIKTTKAWSEQKNKEANKEIKKTEKERGTCK